jgi:hypothetical protein
MEVMNHVDGTMAPRRGSPMNRSGVAATPEELPEFDIRSYDD